MANAKQLISVDQVYTAEGSDEYRNARVTVAVVNDMYEVAVEPEETLTRSEMDSILKIVESDMLKKIRVSLKDDCKIVLKRNGQAYTVALEGDPPRAGSSFPVNN